jgi:hypothetical protein
MTTSHDEHALEFNLVRNGAIDRVTRRLGLNVKTPRQRFLKVVGLFLVTWAPLGILSLISGYSVGDSVKLTFLHDPEVHARFLITLPLLELAEVVVAASLALQVRHLRAMGVIPERERPKFDAACEGALALRGSVWAEVVILILAYLLAVVIRVFMGITEGDSSWELIGSHFTLAGWWHILVSTPILYFFLFRWLWIFMIWALLLFRVSRFDLELTPTHPDRAGGLGFLGWSLASFATVLTAISTVFSAAFAQEILHKGESLDSLKYHAAAFVITALLILHLPLVAFSGRLSRSRFYGLLEFGAFVWRYDREFEAKWLENSPESTQPELLGMPDVQSMADLATCYDHIEHMRMFPFDAKAFLVLLVAAVLPMLPLVGTEISPREIFGKLVELVI